MRVVWFERATSEAYILWVVKRTSQQKPTDIQKNSGRVLKIEKREQENILLSKTFLRKTDW